MAKVEELRELIKKLTLSRINLADASIERAWLETAQRRYRELVEGKVKGIPGPLVFERLRSLGKPGSSLDAAWLKEAEDRLAAYHSGELAAVDADEVFKELGKRT